MAAADIDEDLDPVVDLYLQTQLPRWVWVVEVHDREKQNAGLPSVIADILVDTTDFREASVYSQYGAENLSARAWWARRRS